MPVGIVDYGMGNLLSVYHAVEAVGGEPVVCSDPGALRNVDRNREVVKRFAVNGPRRPETIQRQRKTVLLT